MTIRDAIEIEDEKPFLPGALHYAVAVACNPFFNEPFEISIGRSADQHACTLPPKADPDAYRWPVTNRETFILARGPTDKAQVQRLIEVLLIRYGACRVHYCVPRKDYSDVDAFFKDATHRIAKTYQLEDVIHDRSREAAAA